jgi:AraC family transcriptional regulator of adaptative response/methylated-DNA-[protein]-cysteine methyltransferase
MKATIQEEWKEDYQRIEQAIRYLEQNFREQPSLTEVASAVHLSPFHFQRLFTRWAGISPKRFVQFLTVEHAKSLLKESASVLDASLESGLSGPGRLHDLFVSLEAVSPGEFKEGGKGIEVAYGFCTSPFGECLMASTERGLCHLSFIREAGRGERIVKLQRNWPHARLVENPEALRDSRDRVFSERRRTGNSIGLIVRGTNFHTCLEGTPGNSCWLTAVLSGSG